MFQVSSFRFHPLLSYCGDEMVELFNAPKCNTPRMGDLGSCRMKFAKNFHQNGIIALRWMLRWKKFLRLTEPEPLRTHVAT
jgi:hypothetical protein